MIFQKTHNGMVYPSILITFQDDSFLFYFALGDVVCAST